MARNAVQLLTLGDTRSPMIPTGAKNIRQRDFHRRCHGHAQAPPGREAAPPGPSVLLEKEQQAFRRQCLRTSRHSLHENVVKTMNNKSLWKPRLPAGHFFEQKSWCVKVEEGDVSKGKEGMCLFSWECKCESYRVGVLSYVCRSEGVNALPFTGFSGEDWCVISL